MFYKSQLIFICRFIFFCSLSSLASQANAYDFSSGVFEFQQKQAQKGNPQSQYKLGNMYENGQGVKANLNEAAKWYKKSAAQNNAAAKMRLTYVDIKQNGYKSSKHSSWLKKLQKDATARDGESSMLLATMYKKGIVVKKDLNKSAKFYKNASIRNVPGAEAELEAVNSLIYNSKNAQRQKANAEKARREQAKKEKSLKDKAQQDKVRKDKQLAQDRKNAAEQRKKQQAAQQRTQREQKAQQDRNARDAAEQKHLEQARQEEQRKATLAAEKEKAEAEKKAKEEKAAEDTPLVDKSKCKGKKARFLTMCR